ncbi:MAG: DUF2085 domain-containing protein [Chloroflexi bacterium]|nr:DUF2085 domain-containing protein [Chloroflexota bacterium]
MIVSDRTARLVLAIDRLALNLARHWLLYVNVFFGVFVLVPFAAPLLMRIGATSLADAIYFVYGFLCHQLPQRSYFLFGPQISYSLAEIGSVWQSDDILTLRQFIGNSAMGWKVAWSDRMVSMYGSLWVGGLLYGLFRKLHPERSRRTRFSPIAWLLLGIVPMGLDGFSHMINDLVAGISGTGFRDTNAWLQFLTFNLFPADFYAGDALGSFNSLARLVTGALFGLSMIWFIYPFVDDAMQDLVHQARAKLASPRAIALGRLASRSEGQ